MKENISQNEPIVYLLQEVPGTKIGRPKYNIIGAQKFGEIKVLLREDTQIVRSPGPITYQLRRLLKARPRLCCFCHLYSIPQNTNL